jgi:hypothetical protein
MSNFMVGENVRITMTTPDDPLKNAVGTFGGYFGLANEVALIILGPNWWETHPMVVAYPVTVVEHAGPVEDNSIPFGKLYYMIRKLKNPNFDTKY